MADLCLSHQITRSSRMNDQGSMFDYVPLAEFPVGRGPPTNRQRRARTLFTDDAVQRLEAVFVLDPYPDIHLRERLADDIGVSEARVQTWFQNKRSRTRRMIGQSSHGKSPPSIPSDTDRSSPRRSLSPPGPPVSPRSGKITTEPTVTSTGDGGSLTRRLPEHRNNAGYKTVKAGHVGTTNDMVIDFSLRSEVGKISVDMPKVKTSKSPHPDAGRPFFTPWATPSQTPPARSPVVRLPSSPLVLPSPVGFPNPWMYGYSASFSHGGFYLQPLPTSPFLRHAADPSLVTSPGLSPLPLLSPLGVSPLLRPHKTESVFVFPDVAPLSALPASDSAASSPRSTPEEDAVTGASPARSSSSGYSSQDLDCHSPIDVCY